MLGLVPGFPENLEASLAGLRVRANSQVATRAGKAESRIEKTENRARQPGTRGMHRQGSVALQQNLLLSRFRHRTQIIRRLVQQRI
jgi:hypothetical protein